MSARRSMRTRTLPKRTLHRPVREVIETLEQRLLFNTVITDTDPLTITPSITSFEYKDARGNNVRITVSGDVSAEFLFARVDKSGTSAVRDAVGTTAIEIDDKGQAKVVANPEDGRDLFHIYIAQASIDSYIAIAKVPAFDANPRPMQPFTGNLSLRIQPSSGEETLKAMPADTGDILLGARTRADIMPDTAQNRPIRSINKFNGWGIMPANERGVLVAGVTTASGVSIGKVMFGGVVTGQVRLLGSIETFYCGQLLTGVTEGQFEFGPDDPNNFHVAGDIRNILVKGGVGTHELATRTKTTYFTGVDFDVKGRVGQIHVGGDYVGFGTIENDLPSLGLRTRQQELEIRSTGANRGSATHFQEGAFGDGQAFFHNDTFATAQFLGSINSKQLGNNAIQLNGLLQSTMQLNDFVDYYAVPLMAGQRINVRLLAPIVVGDGTERKTPNLQCAVFDPDQRLIASDFSRKTLLTTQDPDDEERPNRQELFSFVADRPGIYYIATGVNAPDFTGARLDARIGQRPYQLQVTGVGNLGLGALSVDSTILATFGSAPARDNSITGLLANIEVVHGDLGAVFSADYMVSSGGMTALADGGELRVVDALSLGTIDENGLIGADVGIAALTGSVGLVRASGTGGTDTMAFNTGSSFPIGGDVQYIVAAGTLVTDVIANGSFGVIRAEQIGLTNYAGSISANFDGIGKTGTIDLIDVTQDLGTFQAGGPNISTNDGGNVRYIRVGGTAWRPELFGGGSPEETTFAIGQEALFTEDSGAQVVLTPTQQRIINPITGVATDLSGTLTVLTYPIGRSLTDRGGGGVVIVRASSTRGMKVDVTGGSVEIGEMISTGTGPVLIRDPGPDGIAGNADDPPGPDGLPNTGDEPFIVDPRSTNETSIDLRGQLVDVLEITGNNFNYVRNRTPGEIVSTDIGQTPLIEAENLGIARSSIRSGMATEGIAVADLPGTADTEGDVFPYMNTKNAIVIGGASETDFAVGEVRARQAIGNLMVLGVAGEINANADGIGVKGTHEGINGVVFVRGQIREIMIGEGLLPSGTGEFSHAGIYALAAAGNLLGPGPGRIEKVVGQGEGSDIRGDIISNTGIGTIELTGGGSIINADLGVISGTLVNPGDPEPPPATAISGLDFIGSREFPVAVVIRQDGNIDKVSIEGGGGIIGGVFQAFNIDDIEVDGFGIINTRFSTVGTGRLGNFTAGGFGFRGVNWDGGQSVQSITATGDGKRLKTTAFSESVRLSEIQTLDPYFGILASPLTDLHTVLGTTAAAPTRKGTSASGTLDLSLVQVSRDVNSVQASSIRASTFNVGNNIGSIVNTSYIDSARVTAGSIDNLHIGHDALRLNFQVSGPVGNVYVGGSFRGTSRLFASGQNGTIESFVTDNTLYGNVYAQKQINSIRVGTYYGSQGTRSGGNLLNFVVGRDFVSGAVLEVNKTLSKLVIGGDFQDGALIEVGVLGTKTIVGAETGDIVIA